MKVVFEYDLNRDIENFLKATQSKNNKNLTSLASEYQNRYGDKFNPETATIFITNSQKEQGIDPKLIKSKIEDNWSNVQEDFFERTEKLFDTSYPTGSITSYLTTETRCTYNISENYFFTTMQYPEKINWLGMHELLHFFTWIKYRSVFEEAGLNEYQYNTLKESLTVLLNIEYKDLMGVEFDKGYPQHQQLREMIVKWWNKSNDLDEVVTKSANFINNRSSNIAPQG